MGDDAPLLIPEERLGGADDELGSHESEIAVYFTPTRKPAIRDREGSPPDEELDSFAASNAEPTGKSVRGGRTVDVGDRRDTIDFRRPVLAIRICGVAIEHW